ncbi:extracellular solute-binding protein [Cohnella suwonensis]|uniref:Maltodextrin-binding protein n=1 Tax=Cohnella suwonensis TaxID=696072 RepID=A0ABW0LSL3_9BACL
MSANKKTMALAVMAAFAVVTAACAPDRNETAPTSEASAEAAKPERLLVWSNDDANQLKVAEEIAKKYTEQTGIQVDVEPVSGGEQVQKLALAAPSGKGPDLFYQPQDRLGDLVAQGLAEPIQISEDAIQGYSEAAVEAVRYDGQTYGYPISVETYALYYNKDLIPEPPATVEDVNKLGASLTDTKNDRYGFLMVPDFYYSIPFIANYGGYIFGGKPGSYEVADIGLNNAGTVEGLTKYQQFMKQNAIPETLTIDVMDTLFTESKAGMIVNGLWSLKTYREKLGDKLGTAPLPSVNGKAAPSFVGVKSWFVSSYTKNAQWAADLAEFMTNDENAQLYYDTTGEIPARSAVQGKIADPSYKGFTDQIASGIPMPNVPEMTPVWEMDNALDFIMKGQDVKSVLDESVEKISQQIAASGK